MNKDQIDGRIKQSGGQVKQLAGEALGNPGLAFEGMIQQALGRAQMSYGDIKSGLAKNRLKGAPGLTNGT